MCYDRARRETIVVLSSSTTLAWNGHKWITRATQLPAPTGIAAITYHSGRQSVMALTWPATTNAPMDLWEWDGQSWGVVTTGQPLPGRHSFECLAYDASRDRLVTYGPYGPQPIFVTPYVYLPHTYEWDASGGWALASTVGPSAVAPLLAYDEARGCVVAERYVSNIRSEIWERRGKGPWEQKAMPNARISCLVYDARMRRMLAVKSNQPLSLLAYQPIHPAPLTTFGPGCPGPLGIPSITLAAAHTGAWIGDALEVTVTRSPGALAGLFLGYSNTTAAGIPLPWDLGPVGMSNCSLRVSPDSMWICWGAGTQCTASFGVPNSTALLDRDVFLQAVVPTQATNAAGLVVSDAVVARVGSR